jgi:NADH oxidase (H2O2-forming)
VEAAVALRKRNREVCLSEALDWILPNQFDARGSSIIRNILEHNGVKVVTGERVLSIEGKGHVRGVVTSGNSRYEADMIVLSVGMRPSVELALQAGIEIGELGGIVTNEEMKTTVDDIYACGDCVQSKDPCTLKQKLSLLWPQAERQGTVAGYNCIGEHRSIHWAPDVVNLNVFGTFVGAIGQPSMIIGNGRTEVLEVTGKGKYHCFIISEGKWAGAQFIGDHVGMGILLPFMGTSYNESYERIMNEDETVRSPWYYPARNFFSFLTHHHYDLNLREKDTEPTIPVS